MFVYTYISIYTYKHIFIYTYTYTHMWHRNLRPRALVQSTVPARYS